MPARPFPFPFKVGTDICSIARIREIVTKQEAGAQVHLRRFLKKSLTRPERQYFTQRFERDSYSDVEGISQYLAGRWAAKEAIRKACVHMEKSKGLHEVMQQIMIFPVPLPGKSRIQDMSAAPQGLILRYVLEERSPNGPKGPKVFDPELYEGQFCEVSISHDGDIAQAVAIVPKFEWEQKEPPVAFQPLLSRRAANPESQEDKLLEPPVSDSTTEAPRTIDNLQLEGLTEKPTQPTQAAPQVSSLSFSSGKTSPATGATQLEELTGLLQQKVLSLQKKKAALVAMQEIQKLEQEIAERTEILLNGTDSKS